MTNPTAAEAADEVSTLVARAMGGDVAAFEQLYQRCAGRMYAVCLRMTADQQRARELAHDAFVRAWERLPSYRSEAHFETWMHRITVNVVLEAARKDRRREARVGLAGDEQNGHDVDGSAKPDVDVLARIDLERAIAALPPNARRVFVLHEVEGYEHDEIAKQMHLAPGTVRAHLHRARQLLMKMLGK